MKNIITIGLSLVLLIGGVSSCKKTSKRKLSNDWKVVKVEAENINTASSSTLKIDGASAVKTSTSSGSTSITLGTVNNYTFSIKKDGTWERKSDITWINGSASSQNVKYTEKGVWFFLGKNKTDKFKKNEKVVFVVKSNESTSISNIGGTQTINVGTDTEEEVNYAEVIYTVVESKNKSLILEVSTESTSNYNGAWGAYANSGKRKETITLEQ